MNRFLLLMSLYLLGSARGTSSQPNELSGSIDHQTSVQQLPGGKLQFMVQGCENMCPSMNLFSHGTRMQIICCRNQSFCNKI
ncbi:acrosomal vesicle protein 1, isoform CRA_i [Homo sapiens]|uniref:Isoform 11 of Acrosomal protein SP-10 n=1 Tax=Homo sapiens TaxID=9606 RepID=P26436-11|nr:intraacrosomal protein SP-10 {alternatively spliced, deletion within exons 2 and 3, variant SP10-11} [human, testis, Peptide, 81 aa] [Homo sapiens]EAW67656.1 acrosomal vesicle protein 1, isoform CRA_i [Homo sapiens]